MSSEIRSFYAVDVDESVRDAAIAVINDMKQRDWGTSVRWVKRESLHITLRFLGHIDEPTIEKINSQLSTSLHDIENFNIHCNEIRIFPSIKKPRVIVASLVKHPALEQLNKIIESACIAAGLKAETRQFKAHLTLGRCTEKFPKHTRLELPAFSKHIAVNKVKLFSSNFTAEGSVYSVLKEFDLKITQEVE